MLEAVGIDDFAEKVYRALLRHWQTTPTELASVVAAPVDRVGEALAQLTTLGMVRRTDEGRYLPVSPETAIGMLINQRRAALDEVRGSTAELVDEFRLRELQGQPYGPIEIVTGRDAVRSRLAELHLMPSESIVMFNTPPYATRPVDGDEVGLGRRLIERGVDVKVVYAEAALEPTGQLSTVVELLRLGVKARVLPTLPLKLHIYDERLAIIPLTSSHIREGIAIIRESSLLDALIALFSAYWDRARPNNAPAGADDLSPEEAQVLTMLGAGLTDEAIARQLGVSLRTARRRITAVMTRLHATSRFQAGAAAAHRGWI